MNAQLPTWKELYEWALDQPDDAVVGFSCNMLMGPVNLALSESKERDAQSKYWAFGFASCGVLDWNTMRYHSFIDTPAWLGKLLRLLDALADEPFPSHIMEGYVRMRFNRPITARMFKEALRRVRETNKP